MAVLVDTFQSQLKKSEAKSALDVEMREFENEQTEQEAIEGPTGPSTEWPQGRPILHFNPYMEDLGQIQLEERILYSQFYSILASLDYHSYVQKQNVLMVHRLLDKCQDPRLLLNNQQAEHE